MHQLRPKGLYVIIAAVSLIVMAIVISCSDDPVVDDRDLIPPAAVGNLAVSDSSTAAVTLTWTATGDDSLTGRAAFYDVRFSADSITDSTWESAIPSKGEPAPKTSGSEEIFVVMGLRPDSRYYFAIKVCDSAGNCSGISNCGRGKTKPLFGSGISYHVYGVAQTLVSADIDGDSYNDLIQVNWAHGLHILNNNGDGTFRIGDEISAGQSNADGVAGDFNNDNKTDLAVTNFGSQKISIFFNKGDGTFLSPVDYASDSNLERITAADFDADRNVDLAAINVSLDSMSVWKNNGDGTFGTAVDYSTGWAPYGVVSADLNGDGGIDLVVSDFYSAGISVYINNGDGTFQPREAYMAGQCPNAIIAANLDGDSDIDLAVTNIFSHTVTVLLNRGNGTFGLPFTYMSTGYSRTMISADLDGDGDNDLALGNETLNTISVLLNNGDGTFADAINIDVGYYPLSLVAGDFDNDGDADLASTFNDVTVFFNRTIE